MMRAIFNRDRAKARACRQAGIEYISVTGDDLRERSCAFISDLGQTIARATASRAGGTGSAGGGARGARGAR